MACGAEMEAEHRLLLRRYAALQQRVTAWSTEHARAIHALQAEVLSLRARLLVACTREAWELPASPPWQRPWAQAQAQALLCHTGCLPFGRSSGHGETCLRTQQPCAAPAADALSAPVRPPRPTSAR